MVGSLNIGSYPGVHCLVVGEINGRLNFVTSEFIQRGLA
jgi:hypothetical protein